jgi:hypothetical protein
MVGIPRWARALWHPKGVTAPHKKHHERSRKRERDLHGERRGMLRKASVIRLASREPRRQAARS